MRYFFILFLAASLSSCATIINSGSHDITFTSNEKNASIKFRDSTYELPATLQVERSGDDLQVQLISDTASRQFVVGSSANSEFLFGNLLWSYAAPLAYLIDFTNDKRFYYGRYVYLNTNDADNYIRPPVSQNFHDFLYKNIIIRPGQLSFTFSIPYFHNFHFRPPGEPQKPKIGFFGISAGLEYNYGENKFISLRGGAVIDFGFPVPAPVDYFGEYETVASTYISLTDNIKFNRFIIGYGFNYSYNRWKYVNLGDIPPALLEYSRTSSSRAVGLTCTAYYMIIKNFSVGVIYRPTLLRVSPDTKFIYEHLISLDFAVKIPVINF